MPGTSRELQYILGQGVSEYIRILEYYTIILYSFCYGVLNGRHRRYGGTAVRRKKSLGKGERKADIADATYTTDGTMHERKEPRTRNHIFFIAS